MHPAGRQKTAYEKLPKLRRYPDNCIVDSTLLLELGYNECLDRSCDIDIFSRNAARGEYPASAKPSP